MLTKFKKSFKVIISPFGDFLIKLGLTPNFITFLSLIISILILLILFLSNNNSSVVYLVILLIGLTAYLDAVDGYVARKTKTVSAFGAFLDSTFDRISDSIYIYTLYHLGIASIDLTIILLVSSILISYTRARAETLNVKMAGVGIIERSERIILIIIILLLSLFNIFYSRIILYILIILAIITVAQRIFHVYKTLR